MNLLLDTQVFLSLQKDPACLGAVESALHDRTHTLLLSAANSWEIAITQSEQEGLTLLSADPIFHPYDINVVRPDGGGS